MYYIIIYPNIFNIPWLLSIHLLFPFNRRENWRSQIVRDGFRTEDQTHMTATFILWSVSCMVSCSGIAVFGIYLGRRMALSNILQWRYSYCTILVTESFSCPENGCMWGLLDSRFPYWSPFEVGVERKNCKIILGLPSWEVKWHFWIVFQFLSKPL